MSVTEYLVRDCVPQVNQGTVDVPDWLDISAHLVDWSGKGDTTVADRRTFEDGAWQSGFVAGRGMTFTLNGRAQEDPDDGSRDPGQLYCEDWAKLSGPNSVKGFRVMSPAGAVLFECEGHASMATPGGGGTDDTSNWGIEVTSSGAVTSDDEVVEVPAAPTSADATAANDAITGVWVAPAGDVTRYEVRTFRDSDDVVVDTRQVSGGGSTTTPPTAILVNGLANTTAYYFQVRAQNSAGWGPWSAVSDTVTTT